jgi:glycosyltransferase involved in cell wall biosynthesis
MRILWLASWYPNRTHTSTGDFIERQANALAPFVKELVVIFVCKDESLAAGKKEIVKVKSATFTCYIGYYGGKKADGFWQKYQSHRQYQQLQMELYSSAYPNGQQPDLVHVQVAMRAGMLALHLNKTKGIPYLVTEHWSGYFSNSLYNLSNLGNWYRWYNKRVLKKCSLLLPVSQHLGGQITQQFVNKPIQVLPNVVDTSLFCYCPPPSIAYTFLHPSYMDHPKNVAGMLEAAAQLQNEGLDFRLQLVGAKPPALMARAEALGVLNNTVFFEDEIPYAAVALRMQQSHALLMFSHYENQPCIVLEALCSGRPVLSSRVGGIPEVVNPSNGILVEPGDVQALAAAMKQMICGDVTFDGASIAQLAAQQFNYAVVGQQLVEVYKKIKPTG